jgi:hypothetical protein
MDVLKTAHTYEQIMSLRTILFSPDHFSIPASTISPKPKQREEQPTFLCSENVSKDHESP